MKRKCIAVILLLCLLAALAPAAGAATGCTVRASNTAPTVGNKITVTVQVYNAGGMGAFDGYVYYDASILEFVSGSNASGGAGAVKILGYTTENPPPSSLSVTLTFKAVAAGSCTVRVQIGSAYDIDENSLGSPGGSVTVTVKSSAPVDPTPKPDPSPSPDPTPDPTPQTSEIDEAIPTELDEGVFYIWRDLSNVSVPSGFQKSKAKWGTETIDAAVGDLKKLTLLYLTDKEGKNGQFYILKDDGTLRLYRNILIAQQQYTLVDKPSDVAVPENYTPYLGEAGEYTRVTLYRNQYDSEKRFVLIYLMEESGDSGFYYYDTKTRATMPYFQEATEPEPEPEPDPKTLPFGARMRRLYERVREDDDTTLAFIFLLAASAVLLLMLIAASAVSSRRKHRLAYFRSRAEQGGSRPEKERQPEEPEREGSAAPTPDREPSGGETVAFTAGEVYTPGVPDGRRAARAELVESLRAGLGAAEMEPVIPEPPQPAEETLEIPGELIMEEDAGPVELTVEKAGSLSDDSLPEPAERPLTRKEKRAARRAARKRQTGDRAEKK